MYIYMGTCILEASTFNTLTNKQTKTKRKRGLYFCLLSPFSPRLVSQEEEEVKKNLLILYLVKQQVGFEPGTFWSTVKFFNHLATCHFKNA